MRTVDPSGYRMREGATDWWRIMIIRVIIAKIIDEAKRTQGGHVPQKHQNGVHKVRTYRLKTHIRVRGAYV
jgi:hypothetical protein